MSDSHQRPHSSSSNWLPTVVFAFVLPIALVAGLVFVAQQGRQPGDQSEQAVATRLLPVGQVTVQMVKAGGPAKTGEQVYQAQCAACHASGAAGSPKFGDAAAWGPRLGQGYDTLLLHALKGKGAMSAQGGGEHSDYEIGRAVVYMANHGGGQLAEPAAPAASAASAP